MKSADIKFGLVDNYIHDRGFGFLTSAFPTAFDGSTFFHIKIIKKTRSDIAAELAKYAFADTAYRIGFWCFVEETHRGKQAVPLSLEQCGKLQMHASSWLDTIHNLWDIKLSQPDWLEQVSRDVLGVSQTLELKRKCEEERARRNAEAEAERAKLRAEEAEKEAEFNAMVAEFQPLGFTESKQVSNYIVRNKLGQKYRKLTGDLEMNSSGDKWNFNGAISPEYYARLCVILELGGRKSSAIPGRFISEEDRRKQGTARGESSRSFSRNWNEKRDTSDDTPF